MKTQDQLTTKVSYYKRVTLRQPSSFADVFQIYEDIKSGKYDHETREIQTKHQEGIQDDFQTIIKDGYQADKRSLLSAVCFAGCFDRSKDADKQKVFHSGRLNIDIDENTKQELDSFFELVKSGQIPFIEAAARSVSGFVNGSLWLNILVEFPVKYTPSQIPLIVRKKYQITRENYKTRLHTAFYEAFAYLLKTDARIIAGKAKDLKRVRYLSSDPEIYTNQQAKRLTLQQLEVFCERQERERLADQQDEIQAFETMTTDIDETDAFKFAEAYTKEAKESFADGGKHLFLFRLSTCLNLLGVKQSDAEAYIRSNYLQKISSNCVSFPYRKYADFFGQWAYKLTPQEAAADYKLTLKAGQKLSFHRSRLLDIYKQEAAASEQVKIDLKSGCGSGKTYTFVKELSSDLKQLNGCKTVIVFPLNSKTEKDAKQYQVPYVTGETISRFGGGLDFQQALSSDVILTNQHTFPKVARYLSKTEEGLNIVIDESQTLPAGMAENYKADVITKLWESTKETAKTVTLLSGTPKDYFQILGFKRIEVKQEQRPKINLTVKSTDLSAELTALKHIEAADLDACKLVIKIQSKKAIKRLKTLLIEAGLKPSEVLCLYSSKQIKASKEYIKFIDAEAGQESFDKAVKVVLCTSFINEGIDIYSNSKLHFICIENSYKLDVDDFVQFCDRHRTNQDKPVFLYTLKDTTEEKLQELRQRLDQLQQELDKRKLKGKPTKQVCQRITSAQAKLEKLLQAASRSSSSFNARYEFKQVVDFWTEEAKLETSRLERASQWSSEAVLLSLKNDYSSRQRYLYFDGDKQQIFVNHLALMKLIEDRRKDASSIDSALSEIQRRFDYFDINDQRQAQTDHEDEKTAGQKETLKALKDDEKRARILAQGALKDLFEHQKEVLFQAVGLQTEDIYLKTKIDFHEDRKQVVSSLIDDSGLLFTDYFDEAEKLVKRAFGLEKRLLDDDDQLQLLFVEKEDGFHRFASVEKLRVFLNDYTNQLTLMLAKYTAFGVKERKKEVKVLTALQLADARIIAKIQEDIDQLAEARSRKLASKNMLQIVEKAYTKKKQIKNTITQRKAVSLVKTLFVVTRSNGAYLIGKKRDIKDVCDDYQLDLQKLFKKLHEQI